MPAPGKRLAVFAVRTLKTGASIWVRAGVACVQPDDSITIDLDVLPIDGKLHLREAAPKGAAASTPPTKED